MDINDLRTWLAYYLQQARNPREAPSHTYDPFGARYDIEQMQPPELDPSTMMLGRLGGLARVMPRPPQGPWNGGARYMEELRAAAERDRQAAAMLRNLDSALGTPLGVAARVAAVPAAGAAGYGAYRAGRAVADRTRPQRDDGLPVLPDQPY